MQSLIFKSVAKCRLYDLQEFFFLFSFFLCLLMYLRNTCLHLYPELPGFTPRGPLGPQHMHRYTRLSDPAKSRQTADTPSPLPPPFPLSGSPSPRLAPGLPAQCLMLKLAAMLLSLLDNRHVTLRVSELVLSRTLK